MPKNNEFLSSDEANKVRNVMLSSLNTSQPFVCGVNDAKWTSDENVLVAKDSGEVSLLKVLSDNIETDGHRNVVYDIKMTKKEHDSAILSLDTKFDAEFALTGSYDST